MKIITCPSCGETWDENTMGYEKAYNSLIESGYCIACEKDDRTSDYIGHGLGDDGIEYLGYDPIWAPIEYYSLKTGKRSYTEE